MFTIVMKFINRLFMLRIMLYLDHMQWTDTIHEDDYVVIGLHKLLWRNGNRGWYFIVLWYINFFSSWVEYAGKDRIIDLNGSGAVRQV